MNTRYKITRLDAEGNPVLSLEECQQFFETQSDFIKPSDASALTACIT